MAWPVAALAAGSRSPPRRHRGGALGLCLSTGPDPADIRADPAAV